MAEIAEFVALVALTVSMISWPSVRSGVVVVDGHVDMAGAHHLRRPLRWWRPPLHRQRRGLRRAEPERSGHSAAYAMSYRFGQLGARAVGPPPHLVCLCGSGGPGTSRRAGGIALPVRHRDGEVARDQLVGRGRHARTLRGRARARRVRGAPQGGVSWLAPGAGRRGPGRRWSSGHSRPAGGAWPECPRCHPVTGRTTGRPVGGTRGPCGTWRASAMEGAPVDDPLMRRLSRSGRSRRRMRRS